MFKATLLLLALVLPVRSFANCYVLQNNTNAVQTWHFAYSQPMELPLTVLKLEPHTSFPADQQWCWDTEPQYYATVSIDPPSSAAGAYTPSWQGQLIIGNGTASNGVSASPSGTYALNPRTASSLWPHSLWRQTLEWTLALLTLRL